MNRELTSIAEIKAAVDAGADVRAGNDNYRVIRDSIGQYLIAYMHRTPDANYIGLHGREGTQYEHELNMTPIYVKPKAITIQWGEVVPGFPNDEVTYYFDTNAEIAAFRKGIQESQGWFDFEITYTDEELE